MSGQARVLGSLKGGSTARRGDSSFSWARSRFSSLCVLLTISTVCAAAAIAQELPVTNPEKAVRACVTNYAGDGVSVIDPYRSTVVAEIPTASKPHGEHALAVVDARRREVLNTVPVGRHPYIALRSPDRQRAVVSNTASSDVSIIVTARYSVVATTAVGRSPKRLAIGMVETGIPRP